MVIITSLNCRIPSAQKLFDRHFCWLVLYVLAFQMKQFIISAGEELVNLLHVMRGTPGFFQNFFVSFSFIIKKKPTLFSFIGTSVHLFSWTA